MSALGPAIRGVDTEDLFVFYGVSSINPLPPYPFPSPCFHPYLIPQPVSALSKLASLSFRPVLHLALSPQEFSLCAQQEVCAFNYSPLMRNILAT